MRFILKSKLNRKNKNRPINDWVISVLRHGSGIIRWTKDELQTLDRMTRQTMT